MDGNDCFGVGIEVAYFSGVDRTRRALRDFNQSHRGTGVNHSRIDRKAPSIDRASAGRNGDIRAYRLYLAVADHDRAVFNLWTTDGNDARAGDGKHTAGRIDAKLRGRVAGLLRECG